MPFPVEPFPGRKGASDRVALVELFTDTAFTPTVAANIAFDAALQRYTPKEAVFIQYHLAHPNPSVLVNRDTEKRKAFYAADLEGLPAMFVDGKLTPALDGGAQRGKEKFATAREAIDQALEVRPMAQAEAGRDAEGRPDHGDGERVGTEGDGGEGAAALRAGGASRALHGGQRRAAAS